MMKALFNVHGVAIEVTSDHPLPFEMITEELRMFRIQGKTVPSDAVRIRFTTLPPVSDGESYPTSFAQHREVSSHDFLTSSTLRTRFGKSAVAVINHLDRRRIEVGVIPEPWLIPDPAYFHCFAQPISIWFKQRGLFFMHAGCVAQKGGGILLAGPPGAGKSSLALLAVKEGFQFLGDEQPLLSRQNGSLLVQALHRRVRMDRSVARLFPEFSPLLKSSPARRLIFPLEKIWPKQIALSCRPRLLIFPRFSPRAKLQVARLDPMASLARLMDDFYFVWYRNPPWSRLSDQHLGLLGQLVNQVPAYTLKYGTRDFHKTPSIFRRLLRG